jgi:hypothetical protein
MNPFQYRREFGVGFAHAGMWVIMAQVLTEQKFTAREIPE